MKLKITSIVFALCLNFPTIAQTPVNPEQASILQHKLDSCLTAFNLPGIAATLLLPENKYWNGVSGLSDIYTSEPMNTSHLFYQASVTKMFVATIIFQMYEENLLSLEDNVGMYLPPIPTVPESTKIRYLLNHRSGLYDVFANSAATNNWYFNPNTIWEPIDVLLTYNNNPLFNQNAGFSYSNTNYILLGMIIEAITGKSFAEELESRISAPLQLDKTFFLPFDTVTGNITKGWTSFTSSSGPFTSDAAPILTDCFESMAFTSGAMVSSPQDVAKFNRLLFSGGILHDSTLNLMKTCTDINLGNGCNGYGFGLMRYNFAGNTYFGHAGDINGFTQLTIHNEPDSITLTISINRNNAPRGPVAAVLLNALQEALLVDVNEPEISSVRIFPNPAKSIINIEYDNPPIHNLNIELYNQLGQKINIDPFVNSGYSVVLNTSHVPGGYYFLRITGAAFYEIKKVIIQN